MSTLTFTDRTAADLIGQPLPIASFLAPHRFDVHTISDLRVWADERSAAGHHNLTIDASAVRFVDAATVEAIDELHAALPHRDLVITSPSIAMELTLEFLRPTRTLAAVA
jgi:anti-anti-sigma regulatory factor